MSSLEYKQCHFINHQSSITVHSITLSQSLFYTTQYNKDPFLLFTSYPDKMLHKSFHLFKERIEVESF